MSPNNSISANRHSLRREGRKAIIQKQSLKIRLRKEHMQQQLLPTAPTFQSCLETLPSPLYEVKKRVHHRLALLQHLTVHNIASI